ncbi:type II toxin-antitoxin system HicA family toxin [Aquiflexum sp.]|jgi:predicted RNA binding protein YcfA (HicA-like mRNA interferase family)|uniref:type II toxin-antitoxin system HicA family toxin n=1 Tax=Aquiflexum sp. TaxID=1872584 RepID=UPI0035939430
MKVSEILKILTKDGWYLFKNGKKHDLYRHPTKPGQIPIPRHQSQELRKGTEQSILKDAGLK